MVHRLGAPISAPARSQATPELAGCQFVVPPSGGSRAATA